MLLATAGWSGAQTAGASTCEGSDTNQGWRARSRQQPLQQDGRTEAQSSQHEPLASIAAEAKADLQKGIELTREGRFAEAIPVLLAAQSEGEQGYAARFNLALCYLGSGQYGAAIARLREMKNDGYDTAAVNNLMAQALLGDHQPQQAWIAIEAAAKLTPRDETMYGLLLNACTDHYQYSLGLRVAELGLQSLPDSARLHYERAVLLARMDRMDDAKPEFTRAASLGGTSDLGYLASVQELLYEEKLPEALNVARTAVQAGHRDYQMLSLLGTILMYEGAAPGQPQFQEAQRALEESVAERADYSTSQIALGKLYLMEGRGADAIAHLEVGRRLEPQNAAVYTSLAAAYRRVGNKDAAEQSLRMLAALLREKSETSSADVMRP